MAFIPVCNRERAAAASQAVVVEGVSPTGVDVDWVVAVLVGEGSGVIVGVLGSVAVEATRAVGVGSMVWVGDEGEIEVESIAAVPLGEGVGVDSMACVGDGDGMEVNVSERLVGVARIAIGFASSVTEGVSGTVVEAAVRGCEAGLQSRRKNRIKRMRATINLKTS